MTRVRDHLRESVSALRSAIRRQQSAAQDCTGLEFERQYGFSLAPTWRKRRRDMTEFVRTPWSSCGKSRPPWARLTIRSSMQRRSHREGSLIIAVGANPARVSVRSTLLARTLLSLPLLPSPYMRSSSRDVCRQALEKHTPNTIAPISIEIGNSQCPSE